MDVVISVNSRSSKMAAPGCPRTVQATIVAGPGKDGKKASATKHLRYRNGQYVGVAWDARGKPFYVYFSTAILEPGGLHEQVGEAA